MAAITFNTALQVEQLRDRLQTVFARLCEMLDAFVSYRMRLAAAAAEHARPRQVHDRPSPSITEK